MPEGVTLEKVTIDTGAVDVVGSTIVKPWLGGITPEVAADISRGAPVGATGQLQGSVGGTVTGDGADVAGEISIDVDYWWYVEYGTEFMDPQPFVRPAFFKLRGRLG